MNSREENQIISFSKHLQTAKAFEESDTTNDPEKTAWLLWNESEDKEGFDPSKHMSSFYEVYYKINRQKENRRKSWQRSIVRYSSIAAVFIFTVVIASVWLYPQKILSTQQNMVIESPDGVRTRFFLPDGSNGWLNCGSSIRVVMDDKSRRIDLRGEAFFNVVRQNGRPFEVNTSQFTVGVLGTRFNVYNYPGEDFAEVALQSGSVSITGKSLTDKLIMKPGELLSYQKSSNKIIVKSVDPASLFGWIDGTIQFNNEPLRQMIPKIERFYHIDIDVEDDQLLDYTFYGKISNEPIENLLELMELAIPMRFSMEKRIQSDNGEFLNRKVVLQLK